MASLRVAFAARLAQRGAKAATTPASLLTRRYPIRYALLRSTNSVRSFATNPNTPENAKESSAKDSESDTATETATRDSKSSKKLADEATSSSSSAPDDWEANPNFSISSFKELPHPNFGVNQHILINAEFKEVLRQVLWQFRAPIRYAFAYGSGVFPQSKRSGRIPTEAEIRAIHPKAPAAVQRAQDGTPKMIDFIFGVTFTQHWHSLNLNQHRDHYSFLGSLGSGAVSAVQDRWGAGVYFNPYVVINGILVKYGVVNLDTLERDLREWDTLYLAGRLHKPVKILRDDARIRLANQINLLSALRTALLLLPPNFTERELYNTIAGISYLGDPRMAFPTENPQKVANIVGNNLPHFRRLYAPLIETLPNVEFNDPGCLTEGWMSMDNDANLRLVQDMDPVKRGNMVRRLPKAFRSKLYFEYQKKFAIPQNEFDKMMAESRAEDTTQFRKRQGGSFEQRIAQDDPEQLRTHVRQAIKQTVSWPSTTQSLKGALTAGIPRMLRYLREKFAKSREGKAPAKEAATTETPTKTDEGEKPKTGEETKAPKSEKTS
ncbi:mitochondrial matrix Mmp37 [Coniochaeta sp. PMI_546]|nr:mitochondrial matrix Mmp37 [Coniochaeta sp. PMI_546]